MAGRAVSYAERGVWFLQQAAGAQACNLGTAVRISSGLRPERLFAALDLLADRHEAMRTTYGVEGGSLVASARAETRPQGRLVDAVGWSTEEVLAAVRAAHTEPFDLAGGAPARLTVWERGADGHVVFFAMHHAVTDWTSMVLCASELFALYSNGLDPAALRPLTAGYGEFVEAQQAMLSGPAADSAAAYWDWCCRPGARPGRCHPTGNGPAAPPIRASCRSASTPP